VSGSLKIERSRRVSRQKFNRYNRLGVVKFARCNAQNIASFLRLVNADIFSLSGNFLREI